MMVLQEPVELWRNVSGTNLLVSPCCDALKNIDKVTAF